MGTTVTAAYVAWPHMYVAHVGDSRCYLLHLGKLVKLTTDHTMAERIAEELKIEVAESSHWHHALWNMLGGGEKNPEIKPEISRVELEATDVIMLCSDGLNKHVSDDRITQILQEQGTAAEACAVLVKEAIEGGGSDNVTAVVARRKRTGGRKGWLDGPTKVRVPTTKRTKKNKS